MERFTGVKIYLGFFFFLVAFLFLFACLFCFVFSLLLLTRGYKGKGKCIFKINLSNVL